MLDECAAFSQRVVPVMKSAKHMFLLGQGLGEIAAKEGALKIKELTYIHT